jgi:glycosyltransferase involved in cell wall biosynthesis
MRVAYLTHQYLPRHVGGTEVYTRGLALRAATAGAAVEVLTYHESPSGDRRDYGIVATEHDGIPVREIHYNLSVAADPARAEYDNPDTGRLVREELDRFRPDIVHVMHAMKLSASALEACRALGIPFVVTLCDFWFICPRHTLLTSRGRLCDGPAHRLACARCLRDTHAFLRAPGRLWRDARAIAGRRRRLARGLGEARRIIALCEFTRRMFARNGIPAGRIEVIEHGLEVAGLERATRRPGPLPRIGFIGSMMPHKGPHLLLEALARIPHARLECRLHGAVPATPYGERLRALAAADPRVRLMGPFPPVALGEILAEVDLLAVPSLWYENDPLVVKAAFYCGTPVLAARIGSLADMVTPGRNGWLVEPGDPGAWAAAIERLATAAGQPTVAPTPVKTMDENAREMLAIYKQEVARR